MFVCQLYLLLKIFFDHAWPLPTFYRRSCMVNNMALEVSFTFGTFYRSNGIEISAKLFPKLNVIVHSSESYFWFGQLHLQENTSQPSRHVAYFFYNNCVLNDQNSKGFEKKTMCYPVTVNDFVK